jgi:hypothetical protein
VVHRAPPLEDVRGRARGLRAGAHPYPEAVPDLTDDATAGAMLGLVRAGAGQVSIGSFGSRWEVALMPESDAVGVGLSLYDHSWFGTGATLGEAVARAVLARGWWRR